MQLSKSVKNTLGNDETVKKILSYGNRHIYVRLILSSIKWLLIALAAGAIIIVLYKIGETATKGSPMADPDEIKATAEAFFQGFLAKFLFISGFIFFCLFMPIILFYHLYYLRTANTFVLTDCRIVVKRGWLNTSVKSVNYDRITDVGVDQSFFDKIVYGTGTLSISTAGGDGYELELNCVKQPHKLKKMLYELKEEYRKKTYSQPTPPIAQEMLNQE